MYLLLTIALIAVTVFYAVFPKFRKLREKNFTLTNFIITLVATGAGVFLALYFSNIEEKHKEKANAVKILSVSDAELNGNMARIESAMAKIQMIDDSTYTFDDYIEIYKLEKEFNLNSLVNNSVVMRNLSAYGMISFTVRNDNTMYAFKQLNLSIRKGKIAYANALLIYWEHLEIIGRIIKLEQEYIQGNVSSKNMIEKYAVIENESKR